MAETTQSTPAPTLNTLWGQFNDEPLTPTPPPPVQEVKPAGVDISQVPPAPAAPPAPAPQAPAQPPAPPTQPPAPEKVVPENETPEQKAERERLEAEEAAKGDAGEEEEYEPMDFWEDVNALRGKPLNVDLSAFDDPTSPEAYMAVEKAVREEAMQDYDAYVEQTDPRAYAYFLHRRAGGSDAEFFAQASDQLPEYEAFKGNVDLQKQVYTSALKARGVSEKVIALSIAEAEKDGSLYEAANQEYQTRQAEDARMLDDIKKTNDAKNLMYQESVNQIETKIDDVIFKNKTTRLQIPETKKNDFAGFLKGKLIHDDATGRFILGSAVTPDNIADVIEALYFQFSGGDIQKVAAAAARTLNAKRLGQQVKKAAAGADATQNKEVNSPGMIPITQLF